MPSRVKVLQVSPVLFGDRGSWGGGERYAVELARALAWEVPTRLLTVGSPERKGVVRDGELEIVTIPERVRWEGHELNALSEQLITQIAAADIVHVHQYNTALTTACIVVAAALRRPCYITDHGASAPNENRRLRLYNRVTRYLAVSRHAVSFFPELARKSTVIYGGVDTDRFRPPMLGTKRMAKVVFVGRLLPHKGVDVLVDAVDSDTLVEIYGRVYDSAYESYLRDRAAGKNIRFISDASDEEIVAAVQSARLAALPSVYETYDNRAAPRAEYLGLVLIEAMACGTPVVATRVGGMPEVVDDGKTGLLVAPSDPGALRGAIDTLLGSDDATWSAFSTACLAEVGQRFTWRVVAQRCLDAYSAGA
jgi:glycosyltransferase involved in cell wall biosynthesis